ncbi:MAG: 3'-5' exonuclease [Cellvibrionaceae bacterium]
MNLDAYSPSSHDPRVSAPIVLDVEASGFDPHSYPVEIGFVTAEGKRFSRLIRPYPEWSHWCDDAEATHKITRAELLEHGTDGKQVAEELNQWLSSQTVYTDGWVFDKPWLIKLFDRARVPMSFWVSPLEMVLSESMMSHWDEAKASVQESFDEVRHRASTDAWFIQQVYLKARALAQD